MNEKEKLFNLSVDSSHACIDIYRDFEESEIKQKPSSIQKAWELGRDLVNYLNEVKV
jgi:hypothetical protein